jgi:diaminopimelate epimerase
MTSNNLIKGDKACLDIHTFEHELQPHRMKTIPFHKYQGTGNDFVMIDNRHTCHLSRQDEALISRLCDRRFGIGADGLILLQEAPGYDFEMVYFNADGRESTLCGNGGRCSVAFAQHLGMIGERCHFLAIDGPHQAYVEENGRIELKMADVNAVEQGTDYFILNTGSPHYVVFAEDISNLNIVEGGQLIRYSDRFRKEGINVNFVEDKGAAIEVATYERGVEGETLSCGTGVTAAALSWSLRHRKGGDFELPVLTKGGELSVRFLAEEGNCFSGIWLCGPAERVFEGVYLVKNEPA